MILNRGILQSTRVCKFCQITPGEYYRYSRGRRVPQAAPNDAGLYLIESNTPKDEMEKIEYRTPINECRMSKWADALIEVPAECWGLVIL